MLIKIISILSLLPLFISSVPAYSAVFNVSSGDVTGLIAAINAANANGEENTINLAPGTYTLMSIDNGQPGLDTTGLPVITGTMNINGESAETTIIERDPAAPLFRIFRVSGKVVLEGLSVTKGIGRGGGGGILNLGSLTINRSIIEGNSSSTFDGGGIFNVGMLKLTNSKVARNLAKMGGGIVNSVRGASVGTAFITHSTIADNEADLGGGFANHGTATVENSTIEVNEAFSFGGGILNDGTMTITNGTLANNVGRFRGAGVWNLFGTLKITNSTIAGNEVSTSVFPVGGGGIHSIGGIVELQNTILALNTSRSGGPDCTGPIASFGNNIIGDPTGCDITLQPSDFTGDPGLGAFIDSGAPGTGRFPLLATSAAIDAGNANACPATDQLETPRRGRCDIGAVEFYPVVNDLVALANVKTDFDPTPVPNGPAGTFRVTAEFTNTGTQTIGHRFAEVVELAGENLLLNADRGAGGVGARLTSVDSASKPFLPGATETFEFIIGLQKEEPFTFFINLLGDPGVSNTSVTHLGKQ